MAFSRPDHSQNEEEGCPVQLASSGSIVLYTMEKKNKPLLDNIHCLNNPQSPSTAMAKTTPFPNFSTFEGRNEVDKMDFLAESPVDRL